MTNYKHSLISTFLALHLAGRQLFHSVYGALDSNSCAFPNGQQAAGYVVCSPTSSQSSCCLEGEACLQNGLCYGAIGFMYRGACAGGWGNSTACPDYCSQVAGLDGSWANILPCYSNNSAPSYNPNWWCGLDTACNLDVANAEPTRNSIFSLPWMGKAAATILANGTTSPGCSSSNQSATTIGPATTVTVVPSATSDCLPTPHVEALSSGAIAGLAIMGGLTLVSIAWALGETRARRRQWRNVSNGSSGQAYYEQPSQIPPGMTLDAGKNQYKYEMEARAAPAEMDGRNKP